MMAKSQVDISKLQKKITGYKKALEIGAGLGLAEGTDLVYKRVIVYVTGPHYGKAQGWRGHQTGKVPIPRLSGDLKRSIRRKRLHWSIHVIYADENKAPYAKHVHFGARGVPARPFLTQPAAESQVEVSGLIKKRLVEAVKLVKG